jgi:hypothetical protein
MEAFSQNDSPPKVAQALSQSDPISLGSTPRHAANQIYFRKEQIA